MDSKEKNLLEETAALAKKNNKMLKSMQRRHTFSVIVTVIKWLVVLGVAVWAYSLIEPILIQIQDLYQQVSETTSAVNSLKDKAGNVIDTSGLQNLLNTFKINGQ